MHTINVDTIAEGHEKVVRLIMGSQDFNDVTTEDKELTFEYPEPVNIHIRHPDQPPFSSPSLQFGKLALEEYRNQMLNPRRLEDRPGAPDFSYLYSNLIFDFPRDHMFKVMNDGGKRLMRADWYRGNGRGDGTNQVEYVVQKLLDNPTSRRCVISLFEPQGHPMMDDPPCLNHIQFMLRNSQLNMHALFRSNDMLSAWGGNAYGLLGLMQKVLDDLKAQREGWNIQMGWLETTSISAHIYWQRDQHELAEFKKRWH